MCARNVPAEPERQPPRKKRHFLSYKRRWLIWGSLFLLIGVLLFYNWLTQDHRVRSIMERELTSIVGGPVTIGYASFSIVGGLDVRDVTVSVDDAERDDSTFLTADYLLVRVNYRRLFARQLELERIEARGVEIILSEDPETQVWNIRRLIRSNRERDREDHRGPPTISGPSSVPEVQIADARLRYLRRIDGVLTPAGDVGIDANLFPMPNRRLGLNLVTAPAGGARPTRVVALFDADSSELTGRISELNFDDVLRGMLPGIVKAWFDELDFAGRFSVPHFRYRLGGPGGEDSFALELTFDQTRARIEPKRWMSARDEHHMAIFTESVRLMKMLGMGRPIDPSAPVGHPDDDVYAMDLLSYMGLRARRVPLYLSEVNGQMLLTQQSIELQKLSANIQGQSFELEGKIEGYDPNAPSTLRLRTAPETHITIPPSRQFMTWLPEDVRRSYLQFKPEGKGTLSVQLTRATAGGPLEPIVVVSIFETALQFEDFPYPLRDCSGDFIFSHDANTGEDMLRLKVSGYGVAGGPNAESTVQIAGDIGPFVDGRPGVDVRVRGESISSEPAMRHSFPKDVAKAMQMFGPLDYGYRLAASPDGKVELTEEEQIEWPQFFGDFTVLIEREPGRRKNVNTNVELQLKKASGTLRAFPYPMRDLSALVKIIDDGPGPNRLELHDLKMSRNGADLTLNGLVHFTNPVDFNIHANALNVPVNEDLLSAVPATERAWMQKAALAGRVDIKGQVFSVPGKDPEHGETDFELALNLRGAELLRDAKGPAITNIEGPVQLEPARLRFKELTGRRGEAEMKFSGVFDWADGSPDVDLQLAAQNLLLDKVLRDILPEAAQESFDANKPEGTTDLELHYVITTPPAKKGEELAKGKEDIELTLRPKALAAMPDVFSYRLENLGGAIHVRNNHVRLMDLTATHGETRVHLNGEGDVGEKADFSLVIDAKQVKPDEELLVALPEAVADVLTSLETTGTYDVRFDKFHIRNSPERKPSRAGTQPSATTQPTEPIDIDFDCEIVTENGALNVGLPVTNLIGSTKMAGEVRESTLTQLDGNVFAKSYLLMDRPGGDLTARIRRPLHFEGMLIQDLRSSFAGGAASGDVTLLTPVEGSSQYAVSMLIQNAELASVVGDAMSNPAPARLSASFDVEGVMGDTGNRRGRGNVSISGKGMYEAPIILGFFRLVNFGLPVREGVNQVDLSYTLVRDRATFDSIEMTAPGLRIYGDGVLDFDKRTVDFTLNTENPDALSIPLFDQLVRRAQKELLQIKIKGSLQQPEVKAQALPTFQATLDKVLEDVREPGK